MRRIISLLLAVLTLFSLVTLTSCGTSTYMTVGGQKVSYDFVKSFVHTHLSVYTEEELEDESLREEIRERVMNDLRMTFVILVVADELGVKLSSAEKSAIKEEFEYFESLGDYYDQLLEGQNATSAVFKKLLEISAYDDLVFDAITEGAALGDEETDRFSGAYDIVLNDFENGPWYAAEFVLLQYDDVNKSARKESIESVRAAILAGETFDDASSAMKKKYASETVVAKEYAFTELEYTEEFETAVKALEVGGVSEVIETYTSEGNPCFMVIRRNTLDKSYIYDKYFDEVTSKYLTREYAKYMMDRAESLKVVIVKKYRDEDILDIK